jgi:hypothetical protein
MTASVSSRPKTLDAAMSDLYPSHNSQTIAALFALSLACLSGSCLSGSCGAQSPSQRNPDGQWGVPQFTLTVPAPPLGQGVYLVDIQASYPAIDWSTLDRLYLEGGEYKYLRIGNLPARSPNRPLVITNINGQVRVGGQDHYYLFVLSGGANWIVTGKYDPISLTGDAAFVGHRDNDYTNTRGAYGILVDDDFRLFGTGNSGISVGSSVPVGIVNPPTTDYELSFLEIREVGFAGMTLKTNDGTVPMNNVFIHDNYLHDIGSEGLYIGSTQTAPQHSFNNLRIENNRILRTGTEALQLGQLGDGCEINNNVFALAAIDWKDAFQAWQDNCSQIGVRYGQSSIHHNVFIGSANSLISFFGQDQGGVHLAGDGMSIHDNFYSSFRFLGAFMGGDADGVSAYELERNVFRQFAFQRDEIYAGATHPGHLIRVHATQTNPISLIDNVFDEPSLELVNGLGGALNGTVGNITATGNSRGPVDPVTFHDFMGLPATVDYLLIERWSATSSRAGGAPTVYNMSDYVMHEANLYLCIEAGAHSGKEPTSNPATWQLLRVPGDDVRLAPGSSHTGIGLLDVHVTGLSPYGAGVAGCNGLHSVYAMSSPVIGNLAFELECSYAPSSSFGIMVIGTQPDIAGSDPLGLGFNLHLLLGPFVLAADVYPSDASGVGRYPLPIPGSVGLVGFGLYAQTVWAWDPAVCSPTSIGWSSSHGLAVTIQP